ncbi:MAG: hypothetical protein AVDCRST_MAG33-2687 [uncultured Thermomicrobiales bacterium]|uniref:Uncharacterized protein n=1 Tax=uncultured Thermomicrobiales bacterium TaxID=1645740 RepID=A0A6J4VBK5_9BACT|nr:MAG: hypothetical protein AVDCRST_MAG33-2687 [uncultured Thermomicrobiales bacterium]
MTRDVDIVSDRLPGGTLVNACLDRRVMALADRGQSSGAVGDQWAAMCAEAVSGWNGAEQSAPGGAGPFRVTRVARLDDVPAVAATASRRGLQNPDFLVIGHGDDGTVVQGLDAKFSAETAKPRQVSAQVVSDLLQLRTILEPLTGALPDGVAVLDGMFLCPDYPLTRLAFTGQPGMLRPSVRPEQVMLIDAPADAFFGDVDGGWLIGSFADLDQIGLDVEDSLLASLYYFRLVRAVAGIQADERRALLGDGERYEVDYDLMQSDLGRRRSQAPSAIDLVRVWDRDADTIRGQREAVEQVAGLPVVSGELRERIERSAWQQGRIAPSLNKVRRRLGGWYRSELRGLVGPIVPPVDDLGAILDRVGRAGRSLMPALDRETARIVEEMVAEAPLREDLPAGTGATS